MSRSLNEARIAEGSVRGRGVSEQLIKVTLLCGVKKSSGKRNSCW